MERVRVMIRVGGRLRAVEVNSLGEGLALALRWRRSLWRHVGETGLALLGRRISEDVLGGAS